MIFSLSRIACRSQYLSSLLCVSAAPAVFAASFLGVDVSAPLPSKNVVDTHWGTPVDDPYRFLEDTKDPLVQSWMKGQADATEAILAKLPVRTELRARLAEIEAAVPANINSVRRTRDGAYFALRRNAEDNQFKLVKRDGVDGKDVVLVDPGLGQDGWHGTGHRRIFAFARRQNGRLFDFVGRCRNRQPACH